MYRKPRFLEELHAIREEMAREADYDVELFAEMMRRGAPRARPARNIRVIRSCAAISDETSRRRSPPKRRKATRRRCVSASARSGKRAWRQQARSRGINTILAELSEL